MILLAALFLGETIGPTRLLSLLFAATGLLLVMQPWQGGASLQSSCLAVLSGFFWAVGAIFSKVLYRRHADVDLLNLTAWQMFSGSLAVLPIAWLTHETPVIWSNYLVFALAYNALPATAIAWTLWLYILKVLPTDISGLSMLLVPVCGVLLAWSLLGEVPDNTKLLGIVCIAAGLVLTTGIVSRNTSKCRFLSKRGSRFY
jgi:drug/metabolite transporter (DMT)-like permease